MVERGTGAPPSREQDDGETPDYASLPNPMWRLYAVYGRDNVGYALLGVTNTLVGRALGLIPAFVIGLTVDAVFLNQRPYALPFVPDAWVPGTPAGQLWFSIAVLLAATLLGAVVSWFEDWGWNVFAQRVQHGLRVDTYARLQSLDLAYFTGQRTGNLMSVLNNDVNALETFLEDGLNSAFWITATVVGIGAILFSLNPPLAAVAVLPVPFLVAFTYVFTRVIEPRYLRIRGEIGDLNAQLENNVSGIEAIKTESAEDYEKRRVAAVSRDYLAANLDAVKVQITYFPGLTVIAGLGFAATFLVGGLWVIEGPPFGFSATLTPGAFVTFVIYAQQYIWPTIQFGSVVDDYERAKAAALRVAGLFASENAVRNSPDASALPSDDGSGFRVEYDDVTFAYGGRGRSPGPLSDEDDGGALDDSLPVLSDVSFVAEPGETVGVVGPTGAGKSTLLKLLPRLYEVDSGAVRVADRDVRDVTLSSLRRSVGYVSQEPFLFYGTVAENIRYGSFDASQGEVASAARRAQAHEFVANLPNGYDTLVGERGVKLSGGQRQRIAIARAILKDPPILVLDEATSHVDTETEALIQRSLAEFSRDRTTFVIAHRLSSVRRADTILVLDDGRIVERGSHEDLLGGDGLYANFWRVQVGDVDSLPRSFVDRARRRTAERATDVSDDWEDDG
jgi:ATP-binding cassette subfamily B protein